MPILAFLISMAAGWAIYEATDAILDRIIDKDEDTALDEILAFIAASLFGGGLTKGLLKVFAKEAGLPVGITTAKEAGDFLATLANNQKGLAELNARLGGFAPLAIKFTKRLANLLTAKGALKTAGAAALVSFVTWLVWLPQLIDSTLEKGVYTPEQANLIMERWGLPFRWPISKARATETALKETQLEKNLAQLAGGFSSFAQAQNQDRIIIRMAKTTKPVMFTGTLYSFPLSKPDQYDRKIDSRIDSFSDFKSDLAIQLNEWILGLGGRMKVMISTSYAPFDEYGTKQSGLWLVAQLFYARIGGAGVLLDTIPLGPIDPVKYNPTASEMQTIETQINTELKIEKIKVLELPESILNVISKEGELVKLQLGQAASAAPSATAATTTPPVPPVSVITPQAALPPTPTPVQAPAGAFGAFAPVIPPENFPQVFLKQARVDTPQSVLNIRQEPNLGGKILGKIPDKTIIQIDDREQTRVDGYDWVKLPASGFGSGWIAKQFINFV